MSLKLTEKLGIRYPIFCGAMYPCGNPELVAAASEAGALGIVQPLSLTYVYGHDFRAGLRYIRTLTSSPIGLNLLVEASSKIYLERMRRYLDIALEEGVRIFVTALGSPGWVVERTRSVGGIVFHDVTERKWAERALAQGVDGLICVNKLAGGHAGTLPPEQLLADMKSFGKLLICAGGVGDGATFRRMLDMGYDGVQMGTRFIATRECKASEAYKEAILKAQASDVVLTERLTGVPVAVIKTPHIERIGLHAGPLAKWMLKHPRFKHWARLYYSVRSLQDLRRSIRQPKSRDEYWQAGKSVEGIERVESVKDVVDRFASTL